MHVTHRSGFEHETGTLHPERPARLRAAHAGVAAADVDTETIESEPIDPDDLTVVHDPAYVDAIRRFCADGGGHLDADTVVGPRSWVAALAAAGAGPVAVEKLRDGFDGPAYITVRPPGHHALADQAMGFCLFNNVAVTAARLKEGGERVAIVDWDVHHGNGTQSIFYEEPDVLYASIHQSPFYPYEGSVAEVGESAGSGATVNIPLPAFTAGDVYLEAFSRIVMPKLESFAPEWLLVSCGFDAHAHDPLAELRLVESDYAAMARMLAATAPLDRILVFLEGGYHLPAIRDSSKAVIRALLGHDDGLEPSPHLSPDESWRALDRARVTHGARR